MAQALIPCATCHRHVRQSEHACPFCGAAVNAVAPRAKPRERLGTVAWFTFAVGASVGACGGLSESEGREPQEPPPVESPDASDPNETNPPEDAGWTPADGGDDIDLDAGLPPEPDAASTEVDSGPDPYDAGGPIPIYKAVPSG